MIHSKVLLESWSTNQMQGSIITKAFCVFSYFNKIENNPWHCLEQTRARTPFRVDRWPWGLVKIRILIQDVGLGWSLRSSRLTSSQAMLMLPDCVSSPGDAGLCCEPQTFPEQTLKLPLLPQPVEGVRITAYCTELTGGFDPLKHAMSLFCLTKNQQKKSAIVNTVECSLFNHWVVLDIYWYPDLGKNIAYLTVKNCCFVVNMYK